VKHLHTGSQQVSKKKQYPKKAGLSSCRSKAKNVSKKETRPPRKVRLSSRRSKAKNISKKNKTSRNTKCLKKETLTQEKYGRSHRGSETKII
jgi:hypothetical protein